MIFKALTVGFIATNCYIVGSDTTRKAMVIDPGADSKAILKAVNDDKLSVSLIVITHSHFDHIGAVKAIKEATGAKFAVGAGAEKSSPGAFIKLVAAMSGGSAKIPEPELFLSDGDKIDIDDLHFEVLFTPGHSPDEISL
ncbi:MAG: MBL fold metallo-hydrolase, partial [Chloroflexi bacterium]|nr:MBL fold metallo-hydrolase [Chloroflexota bacterium]